MAVTILSEIRFKIQISFQLTHINPTTQRKSRIAEEMGRGGGETMSE